EPYGLNLGARGPARPKLRRCPSAEEGGNPFRNGGRPARVPGTYTVALTAGGRSETKTVTVEPDPILGGEPARFVAQLRAGLEWRNALSALNEMLIRIVSLETQLKNTQQALRDNAAGVTATGASVCSHG